MPVLNLQGTMPNCDSCLYLLFTSDGKMVDGVQFRRFSQLKRKTQSRQEALDRPWMKAAADAFNRLEGKTTSYMLFGVRTGDNVNRFFLLLQGMNDIPQMAGLVGEIGTND